MEQADKAAPCPPAHRPYVLAASVMGSSMAFIDGTAVTLALGPIQEGFGASLGQMLWVVNAYTLFLAALILVGGAIGDVIGRRLVFVVGIAVFAAASLLCGVAPNPEMLIAARAAQGVGAALLTPISLALISIAYPKEERGKAIGTWAAASAIMTALGPPLGGWLAENFSWRWIFFINIPIGLAAIALTLWRTPESKADDASGQIDWLGAVLAMAGLGLFAYGLIAWAEGVGEAALWGGAMAAGLAAMVAFVIVERRASAPMAPPDLFQSRCFMVVNILTFTLYGALGGIFVFYPITLREAYGHGVDMTGLAFLGFAVPMGLMSRYSGKLIDTLGVRRLMATGALIATAGFALMGLSPWSGSIYFGAFPAMIVFGLGMSIVVPALSTAVFNSTPEARAGAASGVNNAVARAASLFAVAGFGVIVAAVFNGAAGPAAFVGYAGAEALGAADDGVRAAYEAAMAASFRAVTWAAVALGLASAFAAAFLLGEDAERP
ncbi:MAG: MFS transporter [Pseudomonadota bacterium]